MAGFDDLNLKVIYFPGVCNMYSGSRTKIFERGGVGGGGGGDCYK